MTEKQPPTPPQDVEPTAEPKRGGVVYQHPDVVISKAAEAACAEAKVDPALYACRHWEHDWGEVDVTDRAINHRPGRMNGPHPDRVNGPQRVRVNGPHWDWT